MATWIKTVAPRGRVNLDQVNTIEIVGTSGPFELTVKWEGGSAQLTGSIFATRDDADAAIEAFFGVNDIGQIG